MSKTAGGENDGGKRAGVEDPPSALEGGMLSCAEVERQLLEALHPDQPEAALSRHLDQCSRCQKLRAQLLLLDGAVREQTPELPQGFELAVRRRLQQSEAAAAGRTGGRALPAGWRRLALAAAALVLCTTAALWVATRMQRDDALTYHRLRLAVHSSEEHPEVLFDVDLPEGVRPLSGTAELLGRGRTLHWRAPLHRGLNELDLPLSAARADGQVHVRLRAGARVWTSTVAFASGRSARGPSAAPAVELALVLRLDGTGRKRGMP